MDLKIKVVIVMAAKSKKHLYEKNNFCHPVMLAWLSIILVNSKTFKLSFNLSLTHLRALIVCYELKGDLSHLMLKIFHETFENFEITNHASETGWQALFFSYKCFNFRQPLQLLLLRCKVKNSQVT